MKVIITLFVLSVFLFSLTQAQRRSGCCCNEGWVLAAPPDLTIECLYQHDYFAFQTNQEFTGFGARLDSCAFLGSECSGCIFWCDGDDDDGTPLPNHLDQFDRSPTSFTVTPACGNTRTIRYTWSLGCSLGGTPSTFQDVRVQDTIPPEVFAPIDQSQECISTDGNAGSDVPTTDFDEYFGAARATDLCTNPTWNTYSVGAPSGGPCNTQYVRTFIASDGCQLSAPITQTVRFVDTTPPVIEVDALIPATCTSPIVTGATPPTPTDSCDNVNSVPTRSDTIYHGKCTGDYTIERVWSVADTCGNTGYATQIIVVEDNTPPTVSPTPYDSVQDVFCDNIPTPRNYVATDDCGPGFISFEETISGMTEQSERYDVIRTYKASDDCGNSISWREVFVVNSGSLTSLQLTSPTDNPYSVNRGVDITLSFSLLGYNCNTAYLVFDIGAATFVSTTRPGCTNQNGGPIYCPVDTFIGSSTFDVVINVPLTYQPNTLQIRYSVAQSDPTIDLNFAGDHFYIIKLTGP